MVALSINIIAFDFLSKNKQHWLEKAIFAQQFTQCKLTGSDALIDRFAFEMRGDNRSIDRLRTSATLDES